MPVSSNETMAASMIEMPDVQQSVGRASSCVEYHARPVAQPPGCNWASRQIPEGSSTSRERYCAPWASLV